MPFDCYENKRVLNFVQQVFFLLSTEGPLVIITAYQALFLGGTPSQETGTSPLAVYSSRTVYIWQTNLRCCYILKFVFYQNI